VADRVLLKSYETPEAFVLLGAELERRPDDVELWKRRAQLAGWLSLPRAEVRAQEKLLEATGDVATRRRLVTLYTYVGRPVDAVPHALVLIKGSKDPKELEWPVNLALQGGDLDLALKLLTKLAEQEKENPAHWREKIRVMLRPTSAALRPTFEAMACSRSPRGGSSLSSATAVMLE